MIIFIYLLVVLASISNAIMDITAHKFHISIFKNLNPQYWNSEISWQNKYIDGDSTKGRVKWFLNIDKPVQLTDAWHLFKSLMIIFLCGAIGVGCYINLNLFESFILFLTIGVTWNLTFSMFYHNFFLRK